MTPSHLSEASQPSGCPCGRSHPARRARRTELRRPVSTEEIVARVYDAGLTFADANEGRFTLKYARDCESPIRVKQNDLKRTFVTYEVRCRKCAPCLQAKTRYWVAAAHHQTMVAHESGNRTWFGTLTLSKDWQDELLDRARSIHPTPNAPWFDEPECDERFGLVRDEFLKETQRYWKRLRKAGCKFKYFLVFERHKSGLPHAHWLLHEQEGPIRKRELQAQWPQGFTKVVVVGGRSKRSGSPAKAAFYVAKYLSKSCQSRQCASRLYRPEKRAQRASHSTI